MRIRCAVDNIGLAEVGSGTIVTLAEANAGRSGSGRRRWLCGSPFSSYHDERQRWSARGTMVLSKRSESYYRAVERSDSSFSKYSDRRIYAIIPMTASATIDHRHNEPRGVRQPLRRHRNSRGGIANHHPNGTRSSTSNARLLSGTSAPPIIQGYAMFAARLAQERIPG